jgi:N-acyl amino acid synthase of PEP-CTERM/exosortase system
MDLPFVKFRSFFISRVRGKLMFDKYFEVFLADTDVGRKKHYNIRYQVYCEEMGFESKEQFPMEQELDQWDENAVHFLVRLKHTKEWIGAVRLVHHDGKSLPLEGLCPLEESTNQSNIKSVELSRLCLVKEIRKPNLGNPYGIPDTPSAELELIDNKVKLFYSHSEVKQSIIWGLFRAASLYSQEMNVKKWYFLTTKALSRLIKREGFNMLGVGEPCEHRGKRFPYKMDVKEILSSDFWEDYKKGYRLYSELEGMPLSQAASA